MNNLVPLAEADHVVALAPAGPQVVPRLVAACGERASWRYVKFFTANLRNPNTRRAYARACNRFFAWCERRGLPLAGIRPFDVASYIEGLGSEVSAPSVRGIA